MCSLMKNSYISIKQIAEAKGLKSTRSLRLEINKPESKYISREVKVNGGISYEILFSSLEPELQQKLRENETKSTALVPLNYQPPVVTDKARQTANHRINIVKAALEYRKKYPTQNQADHEFLELYNTGLYLPKAYEFIHSVFAKPYNARAKVIERFFLEFQEEFEKMMPSYIGTSIENRPAWMNRNEKLHLQIHQKQTGGKIPTVQEVIKYIDCWLEFHNKKPCPNNRSKSIQEMLDTHHHLQKVYLANGTGHLQMRQKFL